MTSIEQIEEKAIESAEGVGKIGTQVSLGVHHAVMAAGEPGRKVADALHGTWPLHPVLTDLTIGAWTMGLVFDGLGAITDSDKARGIGDTLALAGTISAVPTAITGLTDFSTFPDWSANTATWHAAVNTVGLGLYSWSVRERRRGNHGRGAIISSIAFGFTCLASWLGGTLVYKQKVGVNHAESFEKPKRWKAVLAASELSERKLKRVEVDGKGVLLYRTKSDIFAIGSVCSHAGGPLEEGKVEGNCVSCPWHDSVFDLRDGSIVHGPATQAQPRFEVRERDGEIEIRLPQA